MGTKIFQSVSQYLPDQCQGMFVEIGSDRFEGSTAILNDMALQRGTKLISVDIDTNARSRLGSELPGVDFVIADGATWAKAFAVGGAKISLLYLDNFDYIYDTATVDFHPSTQRQIHDYAQRGIVLNNTNCQVAHMQQLLALQNCFDQDTVIVFDDTYQLNECWVGKCGPCVVYLLTQGYQVLTTTTDCGVAMKKLDTP